MESSLPSSAVQVRHQVHSKQKSSQPNQITNTVSQRGLPASAWVAPRGCDEFPVEQSPAEHRTAWLHKSGSCRRRATSPAGGDASGTTSTAADSDGVPSAGHKIRNNSAQKSKRAPLCTLRPLLRRPAFQEVDMEGHRGNSHPERPLYPVPEDDPLDAPRGIIFALCLSLGVMCLLFFAIAVGEALWRMIPVAPELRPAVACAGFATTLASIITWAAIHRFRSYRSWSAFAWLGALIWALALRCLVTAMGLS